MACALEIQRVVARHQIRIAVRQAVAETRLSHSRHRTAALRDFTPAVLESIMEAGYRTAFDRKAFLGGVMKKVKGLIELVKKAPQLWQKLKDFLGIQNVLEIPKAILKLLEKGKKALRDALAHAFTKTPLKIFFLKKGTISGLSGWINRFINQHPKVKALMDRGAQAFDTLDKWLRKWLPVVGTAFVVAIYIFIWMNVQEVDWNFAEFMAVFTGHYTLGDMFANLPNAAITFLIGQAGFHTMAFLPIALAARILWLYLHKYIHLKGGEFQVDEEAIRRTLHIPPEEPILSPI